MKFLLHNFKVNNGAVGSGGLNIISTRGQYRNRTVCRTRNGDNNTRNCWSQCHTIGAYRLLTHQVRSDAVGTSIVSQRSEEHTSELQSRGHLVCRLLLEKKKH